MLIAGTWLNEFFNMTLCGKFVLTDRENGSFPL